MKQRCLTPTNVKYPQYGGRGIKVCDKWLRFEGFLEDMGERPEGKILDRIDPNGNYEPGNCRWATRLEQANNTTGIRVVAVRGERSSITQMAKRHNISVGAVYARLKSGMDVERAFTAPLSKRGRKRLNEAKYGRK
jgi:hypothetical protein